MTQAFPQTSPMALVHCLKGDPKATELDVGSPVEYQAGNIPGARLLPVDKLKASNLVDFADGAGLITAGITRWCGMAQLLARMPWNRRRDCGHAART